MILKRIQYEMFESDADWLDHHLDTPFHEIDGQIRLDLVGSERPLFISWNQVEVMFEIATGPESLFSKSLPVVRDMSSNKIWRDLIGKDISWEHLGKHRQVLRITDGSSSVYCCSREGERWQMDVVHVTRQRPDISSL
jgi:hypothetical protein